MKFNLKNESMRKKIILVSLFLISVTALQAQSVLGKWYTTNSETGKRNSVIEIYEKDGELQGKVVQILKAEDRNKKCTKCTGKLKNKPIEGLILLRGMEKDGKEYSGGVITDPYTGKDYKCKLWVDEKNPDVLKVRGYVGFLYQTRSWERAK